jgi:glyoxylase-like metal-dependent hydrolase (beta-lactamase superfamily II)
MSVEVDVIVTAKLAIPRAYAFRGAAPWSGVLRSQCLAWVVRHPSAGVILIDTGMHADAATDLRRDFGLAMSVLFGGLKPVAPFDSQLRERGIEPGDVERVVMTHLHVDHTSGMRLLPNARFTIARREWAAATKPRAAAKGYVGHHLPPADRVDLVDFDGGDTVDLLGDGSIRLMPTPGHSPGHMSVLVDDCVLVVGDAAYTLESVHEQRLPLFTADDTRSRKTLRELKAFADTHPDAILVPTHDPDAWRAVSRPEAPSRAARRARARA